MNDLTDGADRHSPLIARMRSALDEVAAGTEIDAEPIRPERADRASRRRSTGATTLVGVAATCTALVGGATWALSQRFPSPVDSATPAVDIDAATEVPPGSDAEPPMTTILGPDDPWFTLAAANLVPGAISRPERFPAENEPLFQSWRVVGDGLDGFLFARIDADRPIEQPDVGDESTVEELTDVPEGRAWLVFPPSDTGSFAPPSLWWSRADGSLWVFDEQGLYSAVSSNVWIDLVLDAQQGSGVPIVLPSANATVVSVGITSTVVITQRYTGTTVGTVDLTVTDGAAAPSALAPALDVEPVTVAGRDGWKGTYGDGHVEVVWNVGGGWWGLLGISTELADQADGIIASVGRADGATIPATPVAPPP